jgi:hypothetical protein
MHLSDSLSHIYRSISLGNILCVQTEMAALQARLSEEQSRRQRAEERLGLTKGHMEKSKVRGGEGKGRRGEGAFTYRNCYRYSYMTSSTRVE